jgi:hypothetical protein
MFRSELAISARIVWTVWLFLLSGLTIFGSQNPYPAIPCCPVICPAISTLAACLYDGHAQAGFPYDAAAGTSRCYDGVAKHTAAEYATQPVSTRALFAVFAKFLAAETGVLQTRNFTQIQSMAQSGRLAISDQALGLLGQLPRSGSSVVVDSSFSLQALAELQNAAQVEFGLFEVGDANVLVRGTRFEVGVPKNATNVIAHSHLHEYLCVAPQSG